jgi:hypothetical protein
MWWYAFVGKELANPQLLVFGPCRCHTLRPRWLGPHTLALHVF